MIELHNSYEAEFLYENAVKIPKKGIIVEIGTFQGASAVVLAKTQRQIFTIDRYEEFDDYHPTTLAEVKDKLKEFESITVLKGESESFAKIWNKPIDLIFIDGNHSYEGVKQDIENWLPHLKKKGRMMFHDYQSREGVTIAVDEAIKNSLIRKKEMVGSLLKTVKI